MQLTSEQEKELLSDLFRLQEELKNTLEISLEHSKAPVLDQTAVGRLSRMDAIQQQQMAKAQRSRNELRLKQVAIALMVAKQGEFGVCKLCGDEIGYPRLKARPESPVCVPCMIQVERT